MDTQQTILVIEDEDRIRKLITMYLGREGFATAEAANGKDGLTLALENDYALIILDLMLPEMDGIEMCKALRKEKSTPVIMLTAKGEENHRIEGFEAGADDYVVKPFSPREVVLRVKAMLRRSPDVDVAMTETTTKNILEFEHMRIDHDAHKVTVKGQELTLTPKEYELLYFLASHEERVYDREHLLKEVWKYEFFGDLRTVDTHVKRLREKLSKISKEASQMIVTVWGVGYKFEVDDH